MGDSLLRAQEPRYTPLTSLRCGVKQTEGDIPTRLKRAAVVLFASRGPDGTTVEQIARTAGVNRERVYAYFGGKDGLFASVLSDELLAISLAVPLDSASVRDIGAFAGELFDYHTGNEQMARLLQWEALRYTSQPVPDEALRQAHYQRKVEVLAQAQRDGTLNDDIPPGDLLFLLIAIAAWWSSAPQLVRMTDTGSPAPAAAKLRRRASTVRAAELLAGRTEAVP